MIEPVVIKLIWVGVAVAAYGLLRWRWLIATQDVVVGLVQDAEQWCQSPEASATAKSQVERFANAAYRPLATWGIALMASLGVVVGVVATVVRQLRGHTAPARTDATDEEALVCSRLLAAVLMTSPIALLLVMAVFLMGFLFLGSVKAVLALIPEATVFGRMHQPSV